MTQPPRSAPPATIAIVGDIHDQWSSADEQALLSLGVDLVLFVGDFGNESLPTVRQVAQLPLPKAIAFGNHDAWYTATPWGQKRCPYDRQTDSWFQAQWDLLEEFHVGYRSLDFSELQLSVVGGRPFSWGGPNWFLSEFYDTHFGVRSMEESRDRIGAALESATYDHIIVLSHNGPAGLGDQPEDICGKDWRPIGGDYGDRDLTEAIAATPHRRPSLVAFGHMHHHLRHRRDRLRQRLVRDDHNCLYLNAAAVPREKSTIDGSQHQFSLARVMDNAVQDISSVWVTPNGEIVSQEVLFMNQRQPEVPSLAT